MSRRYQRHAAYWLSLASLVVLSYSNCSNSKPSSASSKSSSSAGQNQLLGGDGYSGKTIYDFKTASACPDGLGRSVIGVDNVTREPYLLRSNCANLPNPQILSRNDVSVSAGGEYVSYNGHIYLNRALPPDPANLGYQVVCQDTSNITVGGQDAIRTLVSHVIKYYVGTGYKTLGVTDIRIIVTATGASDNYSSNLDNLVEEQVGGLYGVGKVNSFGTGGFRLFSSEPSAFAPGTVANLPFNIEAVRGSSLTYANIQFGGTITNTTGVIPLTCSRY